MKRSLVLVAMFIPSMVFAVPNYESCAQDSSTDVCQAYLAGLKQAKSALESTELVDQDSSYRSRALEQRAGERYRMIALIAQKSASSDE
ncbi:hypothetical protein [Photobacterium nomapromontoriensis]|uniref:hypothetical protein n=1 Tax=Photobacterium nomapromontoriensis TaxID=2910237 RepID=UPI003D0DB094